MDGRYEVAERLFLAELFDSLDSPDLLDSLFQFVVG